MKSSVSFRQVTSFVWGYIKQTPWALSFVLLGLLFSMMTEVAMPYYFGKFMDYLALDFSNSETAFNESLKYIAILIFIGISFWLSQLFVALVSDRYLVLPLMRNSTKNIFYRVQRFCTDWHENSFSGATVRKISRGMWATDQFIISFQKNFIPLGLVLMGAIWIMYLRWEIMGILFGVGTVVYSAASLWMTTKFIAPRAREAARQDTNIGAALADNLTCNSTVKSFAREASEDSRFLGVMKNWEYASWQSWKMFSMTAFWQNMVMTLLKISVLLLGAWLWAHGKATVGDMAFLLSTYHLVSGHLRNIGENIRNLQKSVNDMEDMVEFSLLPFDIKDIPKAKELKVPKGAIHFKNITFAYKKKATPIFKDFNLSIAPGEKVALVGHSGGGKTSITKIIQRLYDISSGSLEIDGQNIKNVTQKSLRKHMALIPQEPVLFHRSLTENIKTGNPRATGKDIEKAARLAHAHEFITKLPKQYQTLVGERGVKLSGGERQRVAIARAILADCPLLILDEATSALDSESEKLIQDALHHLWKGKTALIIAHRLSTIKAVDRIIVMEHGQIVEEGTHASLLKKNSGTYKRLYELQAEGFLH